MIRRPHTLRLSVSLALLVALTLLCLRNYYPPLPNPLAFDPILDQVPADESDPLLVSVRGSRESLCPVTAPRHSPFGLPPSR